MLYPTSMPLLTGLALFGLSFLNMAALDTVGRRYARRQESVGSA